MLCCSGLQNTAVVKQIGPVGDRKCFLYIVVGNQNTDVLILQFLYDILNIFDCDRVYTGKRLVQQNKFRPDRKCPGNFRTASFSSRQLDSKTFTDMLQPEFVEHFFEPVFLLFFGHFGHFQYSTDIIFDTQPPEHRSLLCQITYPQLCTFINRFFGYFLIIQKDPTTIRSDQSDNHIKRSRFPSTIRPQQTHNLPLLHLHRYIFDNGTTFIFFYQMFCF